jgi:palmitoyltransferase
MPLHALFLAFYAVVFALVMGSFYCYHLYLVLYVSPSIGNAI